MGGINFTFMSENGKALSKIDRYLVCDKFMVDWPNANLTALPRFLSDHCPLVLSTNSFDFGPIPFKLFNSWLDIGGFDDVVNEGASVQCHQVIPDKNLAEKLKNTKASVRQWRRNVRDADIKEEEDLNDLIADLEALAEERPLSDWSSHNE